jgi:hypothetical protein
MKEMSPAALVFNNRNHTFTRKLPTGGVMYKNENITVSQNAQHFFTITLNELLQGDSKNGLGRTNHTNLPSSAARYIIRTGEIINELFIQVHK